MSEKRNEQDHTLEISLVIVTAALTCLLYQVAGMKMVVLNLFYLPIGLAAVFLGRYRAGILAVFSVIGASTVVVLDLGAFAAISSPMVIALSLTIWAAVLGLNALLVGTLSDERTKKITELHDAYVGVVEVLSRYLNNADPRIQDRSQRVAELSHAVAVRMKLSEQECDDVRVAALLQDIENIDITAKVIRKAVGNLKTGEPQESGEHTFHGTDLVCSLGTVLRGALPLLSNHSDQFMSFSAEENNSTATVPFGARIIATVRAYDDLRSQTGMSPGEILCEPPIDVDHHPAVLDALEKTVLAEKTSVVVATPEPALAGA
jgi:K+-sensing histidine kinase KdpD